MKVKIATYISIIGHPLLMVPVVATIMLFVVEQFSDALWHSSLIIVGIFVPIAIKNYRNTKKGVYTNFDVSDKTQRQSWYTFASIPLVLVTVILFLTDQPMAFRFSLLFSLILLVISQLLNFYIKSSLHVSAAVFLGFLVMPVTMQVGLLLLFFSFFIAWARIILKRHTLAEVFTGFLLGLSVGLGYYFLVKKN